MNIVNIPSVVADCRVLVEGNCVFVNDLLVEPDAAFMLQHTDNFVNEHIAAFSNTYVIDVTAHCNMSCKYCYYKVDNTTENRSIQSILDEAFVSGHRALLLMGAEPTTRSDLPELIQALTAAGFAVGITSNGKLFTPAYLAQLREAGLRALNYSMHFTHSYKLGKKKAQVLKYILESGIPISQLSFTISTLDELRDVMGVIGLIQKLGVRPEQFVIRAGAAIGNCFVDSGLFMSDMMKVLINEYNLPKMKDGGSNLYYQEFMVGESNLHLVRHPTNATVTPFSRTGPVFGTAVGPVLAPVYQRVLVLTPAQIENERGLLLSKSRVIHEVVRDFVVLRAIETPLMPNRLWIHCDIKSWGLDEARQSKHIWPAFLEILRQKGYTEIFSCIPPEDLLLQKWQVTHGMEPLATVEGKLVYRKEL